MVEVTGTEQRRRWAAGELPPVEMVRPGLWSVPVPIPDSPLRYTLVYALELAAERGLALVDTGWDCDEAWQALTDGLGQIGASVADVRGVLVTHLHPDHYGLAGRVRVASGAWIGMHPADAAMTSDPGGTLEDLTARIRESQTRNGIPEHHAPDPSVLANFRRQMAALSPDVLLDDCDRADLPGWDLTAVWTPGHSPGHLCFASAERRLLLSGDHVLPRITPAIQARPVDAANPLGEFLDSLAKVGALEAALGIDEVLPAHEYRFRGLAERVADIRGHHEERLDELRELISRQPGLTCWELTSRLSWSRPWVEIPHMMRNAANGETLAHLKLLEAAGTARRVHARHDLWFGLSAEAGITVA